MQKYTVFFHQRCINFYNNDKTPSKKNAKDDIVYYNANSNLSDHVFKFLIGDKGINLTIITKESKIKKAIKHFKSMFINVEAAGGIVFNSKQEMLWIYRLDRWDLPKGKIENDESRKKAALREVEEETGLGNLTILRKLGVTKHIYTKDDKYILKHTHWFLMTCTDNGEPVPQTEEDIQIVKWFDKDKSLECINNTYDSIKDFLLEIDIDNLFL
ncbi:MAG: NUDIX hydrolase [Bacteroidales bacterium]|jgi:8-oxo-dGTP pyrophosphatase MutT (NUDIX family)